MNGAESTDLQTALKELAQDLLTDEELAELPTLDLIPLPPTGNCPPAEALERA